MNKKEEGFIPTKTQEQTEHCSVLIVGGGLVGSSAAVFLTQKGVSVLLIEKHAGSSPHPRAIGFTQRTLELFRSVGLADSIPQVHGSKKNVRRIRIESLAGEWFEEQAWSSVQEEDTNIEYSPCGASAIAQDRLEPMLQQKALEFGADLRFSTELLEFKQDSEKVTASVRDKEGNRYTIQADYMIAADGHRSPIREALRIERKGKGYLTTGRSVLFKAPLNEYLEKGFFQFSIDQPGFSAYLTTYNDGRWVLFYPDDTERDELTLKSDIVKAIGRSDLPIEIVTTGRWEVSALIADSFSAGRIFIAGDAAHTLPPNRGGYGANTGIEDAHNLAWKLQSVLSGESHTSLLDTYDQERKPIAWLRYQQIFAKNDYKAYSTEEDRAIAILDSRAMELGQLYRSSSIAEARENLPSALRPEEWSGQPGTRAPHFWITKEGNKISTLDLFQKGWVFLTASSEWKTSAGRIASSSGSKIDCYQFARDISSEEDAFQNSFGVEANGAVLVRPDGYIAWRSKGLPENADAVLRKALAYAACSR
ncbi:FAD binding domain protein [Leptospira broomii serovar Hurstbridge str. 5399]|uniref:FAD binding domain protein n=1 Tax=Leptospira broomii serovar Hurstbridge str. 5399 TaxID=1049789 RepID=T0FGS5_9LEPT|nr:FAD-dependent oxidoreductase [Leptospira broomii]EQA47116.1 FAD binding domain protein [Leptospira broomii serovar Hurstbridge str. 5399]